MNKKIFWIAGVVCLMSCNNEHKDLYDPNIVVKQYEENWKKQFGEIDPNQTWNMAKQITAKVSINYGSNVDYIIKFYSGNPRDKKADIYLLGKYMMKDGETSTFSVDVPAGLNSVFVSCVDMEGGHVLKEKVIESGGLEVSFGLIASRAVIPFGEIITEAPAMQFTKEVYSNFLEIIPEDNINNVSNSCLTPNFVYRSTGIFTIYPMYTVTNASSTLGIYYKDSSGTIVERDIWGQQNIIGYIKPNDWYTQKVDWEGWTSNLINYEYFIYTECPGITIDLPQGTQFGFYIKNKNMTRYSEKEKNSDGYCYFATFENGHKINGKNTLFLGAEDYLKEAWGVQQPSYDLNDIVCAIVGDIVPDIVDKDEVVDNSMIWTLAYEDLGSTGDFDFNDVVIQVAHVSGENTADVILCAAGGTLTTDV